MSLLRLNDLPRSLRSGEESRIILEKFISYAIV